jgi:hypothetical protein
MNIETRLRQWLRQGYCGTQDEPLDEYGKRVVRAVLAELQLAEVEQAQMRQFGVATWSALGGPRYSGDKTFMEAAQVYMNRDAEGRFAMLVHVLRRTDHATPAEIQDAYDEVHEQITERELWEKAGSGRLTNGASEPSSTPRRSARDVFDTIRARVRNALGRFQKRRNRSGKL